MDNWLIFQYCGIYISSDAFGSLFCAMDMLKIGDGVTRKGADSRVLYPYRKPTQVVESSRLR
jgi:hypothetical protein